MRKIYILLSLIGLLLTINQTKAFAKTDWSVPVEVTEVKDLGLSDRDESKSVIEVRWQTGSVQKEKISAFNVTLSVTYADGTTISERRTIEKNALSTRIEIPSVKFFGGRNSAFIKLMNARVFAVFSKNQQPK
ncbi:MAG: hypothetical protein LH614_05415 [Pyrinomonadaceae bacterium]|nr:hypothetical protein [Pyrinomonadaceae bacterium]